MVSKAADQSRSVRTSKFLETHGFNDMNFNIRSAFSVDRDLMWADCWGFKKLLPDNLIINNFGPITTDSSFCKLE